MLPGKSIIIRRTRRSASVAVLAAAVALALVPAARAARPLETATLTDIIQINQDGFGSAANKYSFAMAVFNDALYVGTLNIRAMPGMAAFFAGTSTVGLSNGAEIWRYDVDGTWTQMVAGGLGDASNIGVRKMVVIEDCLYAVTVNHDQGMEVWRSCDGWDWTVVADHGFGDPANTSGRGLAWFNGYIYVGTENRRHGAQLWRSEDGETWEIAAKNGVNTRGNVWLSDFAVFKDRMYLGTLNYGGAQLFRTDDGLHFEPLFRRGLNRRSNLAVMKLCVFQHRLYFSLMNFTRGFDLFATADGRNFDRVLADGFTDRRNAYLWQMQVFNGRLYAGSYNHRGISLPTGRFCLYSTADGRDWTVENADGFRSPWHYGVRTLTVLNDELIIGSASAQQGTRVFSALPRNPAEPPPPETGAAPASD